MKRQFRGGTKRSLRVGPRRSSSFKVERGGSARRGQNAVVDDEEGTVVDVRDQDTGSLDAGAECPESPRLRFPKWKPLGLASKRISSSSGQRTSPWMSPWTIAIPWGPVTNGVPQCKHNLAALPSPHRDGSWRLGRIAAESPPPLMPVFCVRRWSACDRAFQTDAIAPMPRNSAENVSRIQNHPSSS